MVQKFNNADGGFTLIGSVEIENSFSKILQILCSQVYMLEYIGNRVTEDRQKFTLVQYNHKLYYVRSWCSCHLEYTIEFFSFSKKLENTEPFEDYYYCVDFCDPQINNEFSLFYYFKQDEFEQAQELQKKLGETFTFLYKIDFEENC